MKKAALALILVVSACTTEVIVVVETAPTTEATTTTSLPQTTTAPPVTTTPGTTTPIDMETLVYEGFLAVATSMVPEVEWTEITQTAYIEQIYLVCDQLDVDNPEAVGAAVLAELMKDAPDEPAENEWYEQTYNMFVGTVLGGAGILCPRHADAIEAWKDS